jgi:polysaccharide pyruvyl transferase WcaK-like protein
MRNNNSIILVGTFSSLNKGDAALQRTAINELNIKFPEYSIKLLSNFPRIDKKEYDDLNIELVKTYRRVLPLYLIAVFIYKVTFKKVSLLPEFKIISDAQKVIDLSGDTYSDHFGKLVPLSKSLILYIAKLNDVKYYFCSQSMGPFEKQFNFVKKIIKNGEKILLRETQSVKYLDKITDNYDVFTDIAFNLPTDSEFGEQYVINNISSNYESNFLIGINISYRFINSNKKTIFFNLNNLKNELSKTINQNIIFVGIPHSFGPKKSQNDIFAIKELFKDKNNMSFYIIDNSSINSVQMKGIISCLDFVISARMHLSIASISSHVPTFSLANSHKYVGVLNDFLKEEEIFSADNLSNKKLISQITEAIINREEQIKTIKKNLPSVVELSKLNIESIFKNE